MTKSVKILLTLLAFTFCFGPVSAQNTSTYYAPFNKLYNFGGGDPTFRWMGVYTWIYGAIFQNDSIYLIASGNSDTVGWNGGANKINFAALNPEGDILYRQDSLYNPRMPTPNTPLTAPAYRVSDFNSINHLGYFDNQLIGAMFRAGPGVGSSFLNVAYIDAATGDSVRNVLYDRHQDEVDVNVLAQHVDSFGNVLVCQRYSPGGINSDSVGLLLIKFNVNGQLLWDRIIFNVAKPGSPLGFNNLTSSRDGRHYYISGRSWTADSVRNSIATIWKVDSAGNLIWQKHLPRPQRLSNSYNHSSPSYARIADLYPDRYSTGFFFLSRETLEISGPVPLVQCYHYGKIDADGNLLWSKVFTRRTDAQLAYVIRQRSDGDLLIFGQTALVIATVPPPDAMLIPGNNDAIMIRTDSLGEFKNAKAVRYSGCKEKQRIYSVEILPNDQILIGGGVMKDLYPWQNPPPPLPLGNRCTDTMARMSWLVLTDTAGDGPYIFPIDEEEISVISVDSILGPISVDTLIVPSIDTLGGGVDTSGGNNNPPINGISDASSFKPIIKAYPNPVSDIVTIEIQGLAVTPSREIELFLFDMLGRKLLQEHFSRRIFEIDLSTYPAGLFQVRLWQENREVGGVRVLKKD